MFAILERIRLTVAAKLAAAKALIATYAEPKSEPTPTPDPESGESANG